MRSARAIYEYAVEQQLDLGSFYHAVWRVGEDYDVGDLAREARGSVIVGGKLSDRDRRIHFEVGELDRRPDGYSYATADAVSVSSKLKGQSDASFSWLSKAEAGIKVQFHKANAIALRATDVTTRRVKSERELVREMELAWYDSRRIDTGDIVITEVLRATSGLVAVSGSDEASIEVAASVSVGSGTASLGDVSGLVRTAGESKTDFSVTVPNGFTVAYRALEVDERGIFFRRPELDRFDFSEMLFAFGPSVGTAPSEAPARDYLCTFDS
jgi:hypothetical protein